MHAETHVYSRLFRDREDAIRAFEAGAKVRLPRSREPRNVPLVRDSSPSTDLRLRIEQDRRGREADNHRSSEGREGH